MATLILGTNSMASQARKCSEPQTLTSLTLTTAYATVADDVDVSPFPTCSATIDWTRGDATSIEVIIQGSPDNGTTWGTIAIVQTPASGDGVAIASPHVLQFVASQWTAASFTDPVINPIFTNGMTHLRFRAKKTGGSGTVSIIIHVFGGPAV